ncbi:MAG: aspartate aminotransferase family protein [Acidobacteria bacterium]|nr:aspartate aminotransferase family protein [Acidobacteriota bacterium]
MSLTAPAGTAELTTQELEQKYLLQNYARYPLELARGKGCWLWDTSGKRYLDLLAGIGVNALGHNHPRITRVIRDQASRLIHTSNLYYHAYQGKLAQRIVETSGLDRVFYCNSGTEAIEGALKMARGRGRQISPDKFEFVALNNSFHGRTFGALSITGQPKYREPFEPLLPGVHFIDRNDEAALEAVVSDRTAAIIVEGIQGEGGILSVSESFLRKVRALADKHDALFVLDGIQCSVGRPGRYYSYQLFNPVILPDVMTVAKPIACGLPLGAVVATERAAKGIAPGMHGTTYGGGPLTTRVALEFYDVLDELMPSINRVGAYFRTQLWELRHKFSFIKEVRGEGLMIGVEIDFPCKQFVTDGMAEGLLFNVTHDTVVRFLPPYILTEKDVDRAIRGLTRVFKKAKG